MHTTHIFEVGLVLLPGRLKLAIYPLLGSIADQILGLLLVDLEVVPSRQKVECTIFGFWVNNFYSFINVSIIVPWVINNNIYSVLYQCSILMEAWV